jgi:hypothetical protein
MEKQLLPLNALSFNIQKDFILCFVLMKLRDSYYLIILSLCFSSLEARGGLLSFLNCGLQI